MRIISGKNRSRIIKMVNIDTTRETSDKVRGAIFNLIMPIPIKGIILDLFSGSGAMGLEALSRGADYAYFNDINKKAYAITKENVMALKYDDVAKITNLDYKNALKTYSKKFSFVFLDPPYKLLCCEEVMKYLLENDLLEEDALIICEISKDTTLADVDGLVLYKERQYGIKKICIYMRR